MEFLEDWSLFGFDHQPICPFFVGLQFSQIVSVHCAFLRLCCFFRNCHVLSSYYPILGINRCAESALSAFGCGLKPDSRASFLGPVFGPVTFGLLGDVFRSLPCLLMRVIDSLSPANGRNYMGKLFFFQRASNKKPAFL